MLETGFIASINHLLRDADWARGRLQPHRGRSARLEFGPLVLRFAVGDDAYLVAIAQADEEADLVLELPPEALAKLLDGRDALTAAAKMRGNVEFAEAIGFVLRNLRWDVEEDLSRIAGDIAARRIVKGGAALAAAFVDGGRRLGASVSDYLQYEGEVVATADAVSRFCREIDEVRDHQERLDARLRRLERAR